ncbi:MAG: two-component regulator propeller domain-containing protein, partial [Bacteroidota bacterium]
MCSFCFAAGAKTEQLNFLEQLSISDGLAHNGVTTILEDSQGFIWFGTYDGLNRYDGYHFDTFKNTPTKNILHSNRIRSLYEDANGDIWIGTDEGLSVLRYASESFENIDLNDNDIAAKLKRPVIRQILQPGSGLICVTENAGILVLDTNLMLTDQYKMSERHSSEIRFFEIVKISDQHFIVGSNHGLF